MIKLKLILVTRFNKSNVKSKKVDKNIDIDKQTLFFECQRLEDERTLRYYNIRQNDQIRLVLMNHGGFEIYVKSDKSTAIQVQSSYTIENVKKKYEEKVGVPVSEQRYIYNGKELENCRLISDYNIKESATIQLAYRLCGGALL